MYAGWRKRPACVSALGGCMFPVSFHPLFIMLVLTCVWWGLSGFDWPLQQIDLMRSIIISLSLRYCCIASWQIGGGVCLIPTSLFVCSKCHFAANSTSSTVWHLRYCIGQKYWVDEDYSSWMYLWQYHTVRRSINLCWKKTGIAPWDSFLTVYVRMSLVLITGNALEGCPVA